MVYWQYIEQVKIRALFEWNLEHCGLRHANADWKFSIGEPSPLQGGSLVDQMPIIKVTGKNISHFFKTTFITFLPATEGNALGSKQLNISSVLNAFLYANKFLPSYQIFTFHLINTEEELFSSHFFGNKPETMTWNFETEQSIYRKYFMSTAVFYETIYVYT